MCAFSPRDSAIVVNQDLEKAIANAKSSEEVIALMRDAMIQQRLVTVDVINPDVLYEAPRVQPKGLTKVVVEPQTGRKLTFQGDSELELERSIGDYFRSLQVPAATEPARDEQGRFVPHQQQPVVVDDAESIASAAAAKITERHLIDLGLDPNALREVAAQKTTQSWESAAETFRQNHPEWDTYASDENMRILGQLIIDNKLIDENPVDALESCFKHAVKESLFQQTAREQYEKEISACRSQAELAEITARYFPNSRAAAALWSNG